MQQLSTEALRGAVLGRIATDPALLEALRADAMAAIESRFGKQAYAVRVIVEEGNEISILLPQKSEQLAKVVARVVADIGDRTPSKGQFSALLVHKAWTDPAYLAQLKTDPRGTVEAELKPYGSHVPASATVLLREERAGECLIVVPHASEDLTEAELESVAGGEEGGLPPEFNTVIVGGLGGPIAVQVGGPISGEFGNE